MKRINELFTLQHNKMKHPIILVWAFLFSFSFLQGQNVVDYEIERLNNGLFQMSLTPRVTYNGANNRISSMQLTIRVKTGGFLIGNIINLRNTGLPNEVIFDNTSRFNTPVENPTYDYISFSLQNTPNLDIPFQVGQKVPLFTFTNLGFCTEDTVSLITPADLFYPPNSVNRNADQQLSVLGYGMRDAPIGIIGSGADDCTKECFMGCNDNVQISLGLNCTAEVLPEMIATALNLTCPNGPKGIEILENGIPIPTSPFLNESHIGKTFQVRVIDSLTTNSCWGSIIVKDKTPPVVICENDTISCAVPDFSPSNPILGYPSVTDNCSDTVTNLTYKDNCIRNVCNTGFGGIIERTWTAVDSAGMVGTCVQNIYFEKQPLSVVVFPPNRDGIAAPIISCTNGSTDPTNTGVPTLNGNPLYPTSLKGFCEIDAGFRDDSVSFCVGNKQIIRTWTVVDACTGSFRTDIQIISVQDTIAPVVTCIDTIEASVDAGVCSGTITFPSIPVSDACSGAKVNIETPFGVIDSNGGVLSWIPIGFHLVIYIARDSCNNESRCSTILHVADRIAPIATCNFINDVSLRPSGRVEVLANVFDDGSRDACSGNQLTFKVQKVGDTLDFADFVTFYCSEVGDTVNVNLSVTDLSGNSDTCVAAIVISNSVAPQITCPNDTMIQCTSSYADLTVFGVPTIMDNCGGLTNYAEIDTFQINSCGIGRIIRTFNINHGGNVISCQQVITIQNNGTFDGNAIVWPKDTSVAACGGFVHPDSLPDGFNVPKYDSIGSLCNRIKRYYNDAPFDDVTTPVGCYVILRTWAIIDFCVFDANDTLAGGYWSHVQRIDLVNNIPPQFTSCPTNVSVDIAGNTCTAVVPLTVSATDDCTPNNQLKYSYTIDINSDGNIDFTGTTSDASGFYQVGLHRIIFTVQDDCGNSNTCIFQFTVRDRILPTSICNTDTVSIIDTGNGLFAILNPRELVLNSTDNCTPFNDLIISVTPDTFTCNEVDSLNQVTVTITDMAGNSNSCTTNVTIDDANNRCPVNRTAVNISGIITNEMGAKVDQVQVSLNHPDVAPSMTDKNGEFELIDVPVGNDYTILPERNFDILNGISTFDLVLLNRHILNVQPITSPYKLIAADVNRSGRITTFDIVLLRKLILRLSTEFPNNTSWRFVRTGFNFENPNEPLKNYFPEVYNINDLPGVDMRLEGFVAVKIGDVNGSATTKASFVEGESRNATNTLKLMATEQQLLAGTIVEIPIKVINFNKLIGFQFAIDFDVNGLELLELLPNELSTLNHNNFGLDFIKRGLITTSWEQALLQKSQKVNQEIFKLKFKVKESTPLSEVLSINHTFMKAEAYTEMDGSQLELLEVDLFFENIGDQKTEFKLFQNKPNPFNTNTIIGFELTKSEIINFTILDVTGRVVKNIKQESPKGYNELKINYKELGGKGVFYYQLATSQGVKTRKMLVVEGY